MPPLRRGADRERAGRRSTSRSTSPARARRLANLWPAARAAVRTSASRRRPTRWRRSRGATTCGWSSSRSAPTTSASASWSPAARSIGRAAPRANRTLCHGDAQAEIEARAAARWTRGLARALDGVRGAMASAGYRRSRLPPGGDGLRLAAARRDAGSATRRTGWSRLNRRRLPGLERRRRLGRGDGTDRDRRGDARGRPTAAGAEFLDLRHALDGHQLCDSRSQPGRAGRTVTAHLRVGAPPRLRPGLHPRVAPPERLRPARARCLHRPRSTRARPGDYACRAEPGRSYVAGMRLEGRG